MSRAPLSLTFKIFRGDQLVREETLTQGVIKIGKVASAHLRVDDDSVSRMHAIIEIDNAGAVHVIDLGSTRGTFVNGHKVSKAKLESGDALTLGDMRVELAFKTPVTDVQTSAPDVRATAAPPPVPVAKPQSQPLAPAMPYAMQTEDLIGAKAIEVATMLGDSVVDVKHCVDPKGGKISRTTWACFGLGAASLLVSAVAFASSVQTAAFNKGGLEYWTHVAHKPAYSYRPETLGLGYDWLAFGGLGLGIASVIAGLARMRDEKRSPYYRIGTAPGVEAAVEQAPSPSFPLVAPSDSGDDFVFNYGAGMDGELVLDGRSTPLAELAATGRARASTSTAGAIEIPIPVRAKIRARAGQTTFMVSAVTAPRTPSAPLFTLESRAAKYFAGSLVAHLGIVMMLQMIPVDDSAATIDVASVEPTPIHTDGTEKQDVPPPPDENTDTGGGESKGEAAKMALESGESGKPEAAETHHHIAIKDNHVDPQLARQQAIEMAREAGIMGEASALRGGFSTLTATSDISSGFDDVTAYGAMFGADAGESHGYFGAGLSGFGRGGGCTPGPGVTCGLIGTGTRYNTIGGGQHAGQGWNGPGGFGPGTRRHEGGVPRPIVGQPTGVGDLDRATIRRYIKRNIEKISYCYEKELLAHPSIEGTVTVAFFITPTGAVKGSSASGFDATVGSCVAEVIANIEFPKPNGGGGVQVNYPFTFHAATGH
jgi:FHA domain-containing protein